MNISLLGTIITISSGPFFNSVDDRAYEFSQEELIAQSEIEDTILCPGHQARLRLSQLAPDIVLGDLDPKFNLVMEKFVFIPRYVKLGIDYCYLTHITFSVLYPQNINFILYSNNDPDSFC